MRCLVLSTSNYPDSPVNGWLPSGLFSGLCVHIAEGEKMRDQSPVAWGWHDLRACHRECGMGNEDKVEKALANYRKKLPYFFGEMEIAHRMENKREVSPYQ